MSGAWKQKERLVGEWFNTRRNPLSGRNNFNDHGEHRLGDIIYDKGVVEVKRRKAIGFGDARDTRSLARSHGLPWVHIEFSTGYPDMVRLTVDYKTAKALCKTLDEVWRGKDES